jgi:hypothetical protein
VLVDPLGLIGLSDIGSALGDVAEFTGEGVAGVADGATAGLSTEGLNALGVRPDTHSFAFIGGQVGGAAGTTFVGGYGTASLAARLSTRAFMRPAAFTAGRVATSVGIEAMDAALSCEPFGVLDFGLATLGGLGGGSGKSAVGAAQGTKLMSGDQRALKDLVDEATQGGRKPLSRQDAETVLDWADETHYPGVRAKPGDVSSPSNWKANPVPHIHLPGAGRRGHVPVELGVRPR